MAPRPNTTRQLNWIIGLLVTIAAQALLVRMINYLLRGR
jgi:hypothetical protein